MMYLMPLTISGVTSTGIVVVKGPVALLRGGASPRPFSSSIIAVL